MISVYYLYLLPVMMWLMSIFMPSFVISPKPPSNCNEKDLLLHCEKISRRGFMNAAFLTLVLFSLCWFGFFTITDVPSFASLEILPAMFYAFSIVNVALARSRDSKAVRGERSGVGLEVDLAMRKLSNTTEQLLLGVCCRAILTSIVVDQKNIAAVMLPASVAIWLSGRVLFFVGYSDENPMGREFGFDLTLFSSLACLALTGYKLMF